MAGRQVSGFILGRVIEILRYLFIKQLQSGEIKMKYKTLRKSRTVIKSSVSSLRHRLFSVLGVVIMLLAIGGGLLYMQLAKRGVAGQAVNIGQSDFLSSFVGKEVVIELDHLEGKIDGGLLCAQVASPPKDYSSSTSQFLGNLAERPAAIILQNGDYVSACTKGYWPDKGWTKNFQALKRDTVWVLEKGYVVDKDHLLYTLRHKSSGRYLCQNKNNFVTTCDPSSYDPTFFSIEWAIGAEYVAGQWSYYLASATPNYLLSSALSATAPKGRYLCATYTYKYLNGWVSGSTGVLYHVEGCNSKLYDTDVKMVVDKNYNYGFQYSTRWKIVDSESYKLGSVCTEGNVNKNGDFCFNGLFLSCDEANVGKIGKSNLGDNEILCADTGSDFLRYRWVVCSSYKDTQDAIERYTTDEQVGEYICTSNQEWILAPPCLDVWYYASDEASVKGPYYGCADVDENGKSWCATKGIYYSGGEYGTEYKYCDDGKSEGCVSGEWHYAIGKENVKGPFVGCQAVDDAKEWCPTKITYVYGKKYGTAWKKCTVVDSQKPLFQKIDVGEGEQCIVNK